MTDRNSLAGIVRAHEAATEALAAAYAEDLEVATHHMWFEEFMRSAISVTLSGKVGAWSPPQKITGAVGFAPRLEAARAPLSAS